MNSSSSVFVNTKSHGANLSGKGLDILRPQSNVTAQHLCALAYHNGQRMPVPLDLFVDTDQFATTTNDLVSLFNNTNAIITYRICPAANRDAAERGFDIYEGAMEEGVLSSETPWATTRMDNTYGMMVTVVNDRSTGSKKMVEYPLNENLIVSAGYGNYKIVKTGLGCGASSFCIKPDTSVPAGPNNSVRIRTDISGYIFNVSLLKNSNIIRTYTLDAIGSLLEFVLPDAVCVQLYSYFLRNNVYERLVDPFLVEPGNIVFIQKNADRKISTVEVSNEDLLAIPSEREINLYVAAIARDPNNNL